MTTQQQLKDPYDCGVYTITHVDSGKVYVGSSKCIIKRKSRHLTLLKNNQHWNHYLQSAYNKHGAESFVFKTVMAGPPEDRIFHEQRLMDQYQSYNRTLGYNLSCMVDEVVEMSDETREKMRQVKPGDGKWNIGRRHSEESKKKMSESQMGRQSPNKGKSLSAETKDKISTTKKNKRLAGVS